MNSKVKSKQLKQVLLSKKVLICCGPGGVGKTTTSAVIGLIGAQLGLKTIVLTIDPAKRLANALGVQNINYEEMKIPTDALQKAGLAKDLPLYAMMLDTKRTFDDLIFKYTSSQSKAEEILNNKLYQQLSNMVAGSQEYMAMEKLYEIVQGSKYDLIVLDTPPSRHALDFLEAPQKMSAMIGDSIMKWFLKPSLFMGRAGLKIMDKSVRRVFKSLDKITGFEFLQDLSSMLMTTAGLLDGFKERAEKVEALLKKEEAGFLLITSPQKIPLREAVFFYQKIQEFQLPFLGFIFNRVHLAEKYQFIQPKKLSQTALKAYQLVENLFLSLARRDERELSEFQNSGKNNGDYLSFILPQLNHDVHDLVGLNQLANEFYPYDSGDD